MNFNNGVFSKIFLLLVLVVSGGAAITQEERELLRTCFLSQQPQAKILEEVALGRLAHIQLFTAIKPLCAQDLSARLNISVYNLVDTEGNYYAQRLAVTDRNNNKTARWVLPKKEGSQPKTAAVYALAEKLANATDPCSKALLIAMYSSFGDEIVDKYEGSMGYSVDELFASLRDLDRESVIKPLFTPNERKVMCVLSVAAMIALVGIIYNMGVLFTL